VSCLAFLNITSWRGMATGAAHYYGAIRHNGECHEIKRTLSVREARVLNKQRGEPFAYEGGDETNCFDSEAEIVETALKIWQNLYPTAPVLVLGGHCVAEPQPCIAGDAGIMAKINAWNTEADEIGRCENGGKRMDEISDEYWEFVCALEPEK